jgi:hypothetical protein
MYLFIFLVAKAVKYLKLRISTLKSIQRILFRAGDLYSMIDSPVFQSPKAEEKKYSRA